MAHIIIPLLAGQRHLDKSYNEALTQKFIADYNTISCDLHTLDALMETDCKIDKTLLEQIHVLVSSLHYRLSRVVMWRNIMSYIPLSLKGLRHFHDHIKYLPQYHVIFHIVDSIADIEYWLTLPPPQLGLTADLAQVAIAAMKDGTEKKVQTLLAPRRPEGLRRHIATVEKETAAEKRKQKAIKSIEDRENTRLRIEAEANAFHAAEGEVNARRQQDRADQLKPVQQRAEIMIAKQRMVDEQRKQEEEIAYHRRIEETKAVELEHNRLANQQWQYEDLQARQQAKTLEEADRIRRRGVCNEKRQFLQGILALLRHDDISQAGVDALNIPTQNQCFTALTDL